MADKKKDTKAKGDDAAAEGGGGSKKMLYAIIAGAVVLVLAVGGGVFFMMSGKDNSAEAAEPEVVPGVMMPLESTSINLADNHYLRLGISMQLIEGVEAKALDGSKAKHIAIETFTGKEQKEIIKADVREEIRTELTEKLAEAYDDQIMGVYFTEFVTQ